MDASSAEGQGVLEAAMDLVAYLREHCPWDRRQTHQTLIKHLIEESHEVVNAILVEDEQGVVTEMGDLLLNVAFQIVIGEEEGTFDRTGIWEELEDKMKRRHPHLFGLGQEASWEQVKAGEEEGASALEGVPAVLPPLAKAFLIQRRASVLGFDWGDPSGGLEKVREETMEVAAHLERIGSEGGAEGDPADEPAEPKDAGGGAAATPELEEELGDLLFSVVNLARLAGVDPSVALGKANLKFSRRFRGVEAKARARGLPLPGTSLAELDRIWTEVKKDETSSVPSQRTASP